MNNTAQPSLTLLAAAPAMNEFDYGALLLGDELLFGDENIHSSETLSESSPNRASRSGAGNSGGDGVIHITHREREHLVIRGILIIGTQMWIKGIKPIFVNIMGEDSSAVLEPRMADLPLIQKERADGAWIQLPHEKFQRVIDTGNQTMVLLASHWIALKQIMAFITNAEHERREKAPPPKERSATDPSGTVRWLGHLNKQVDHEHLVYNQWPLWSPVCTTLYHFGPGKPPVLRLPRAPVSAPGEPADGDLDVSVVPKSLVSRTQVLETPRVAQLVRGPGTRTEGTGRSAAGKGDRLAADLSRWTGPKGGRARDAVEALVVASCVCMLKKEVDRRRMHQMVIMAGAASGGS
ncbi:uncharacterized protein LY79DRAFT_666523 [Colletotrichum navitas]|uniref:Uncharacterized protein n=1 Tax=Colletotrichum navitas TaxID=681940 RepID=A0AAD8Q8E0_9PEZI|nr:uncharacterized protein LY79DRAFT_666523 [Colletotrichum navitas]KAK1597700.1 hypothetical protein LY79DRAFT_666523 [Colletotrichum navitas]